MKAMLLNKTGLIESNPLIWADVPDPLPGPGEVRLKVRCCAICRTDLHVIEGDLPAQKRPVIPGHQIVGVIDMVGSGCRRLREGMRIGEAWLRHTCGVCRFCTTGRENLCEFSQYTGYHADGGYAEYALVPEDFAYEIPEGYTDVEVAPLLCAGIIGYRAMKRSNLRPGGRLGIFGFGSSAHIVLQLARSRGHEVYVVTRGEGHQKLAREMGAAWTGSDAAMLPQPVESAIVFAPSGAVVPPALGALDRGGTVALAGIHMTPIPSLDYTTYLYGERDIHPVTANTRQDGRELLSEASANKVRPHMTTYPLPAANTALRDMKEGRIEGTGVLVVE
ncbi:MAG: Alcohol dehydrogenase GroES domain protein [Phycisphaerales bacterium]|nr:Alcohol dehydrogenase GroES domain protein [Phycisphaerales bacterium]